MAKKAMEAYFVNKKKAEQALKTGAAPDKTIQVPKETDN
jgi:hypothetical protein